MEWWTAQQAGAIGAILGGGLCGIMLGAIGGGLCGTLAGRGVARRFVMGYLSTIGAAGVLLLIAGLVAVIDGQPYHVWYAVLLPGLLSTVLVCVMIPAMRASYRRCEARRLAAEEIRRG